MKRFPFIFIFCLSFIFSPFLWAQDDIENEYAYGTITNITDKEILLKEYNYEKEEFVEITYQLLPETKVRNTGSIKSIINGNQIEILYQEVDDKKNALVVVLETEEGIVEQDNPEKAAADAAAPAADASTPPATPIAATSEAPSAVTPALPAAPAEQAATPAVAPLPVTPAVETSPQAVSQSAPATEATPSAVAEIPPAEQSAPAETTTEAAPAEEAPAAPEEQ